MNGAAPVVNGAIGGAKTRQKQSFTLEHNNKTPLTSYFGVQIAVSLGFTGPDTC